ncbi:uncharacterized protein LOC127791142 isoform X3 [Diospyros lotus]|uniref:uncharacterized protein LOC127791142 isoform X3 n=1 Tax=Diospyros lotus TaxID=55363 RepID=UPI00225A369C|nr:uncharacterized protein LOC127791142 isoform X3 [Diospyros lotus]
MRLRARCCKSECKDEWCWKTVVATSLIAQDWKKMKMRRWCETRNRIWSSVEMETKMKAELVFCEDGDEAQVEDGWQWMVSHRKSEMVFSSAVDGDSQEVGDGDKTQVGLNFGGGWQRRGRRRSRLEWERKP